MKKIETLKPDVDNSGGSGCGPESSINIGLRKVALAIAYLADVIKDSHNAKVESNQ